MKKLLLFIIIISNILIINDVILLPANAFEYNKQQIKTTDSKGNTIFVTPDYHSYIDRNDNVAEKVVVIYDKKAPEGTYGARYTLYKPIGKYVGYHRQQQPSPNGYGYEPVWDGGPGSQTPCFRTIDEARHYYYPQWY